MDTRSDVSSPLAASNRSGPPRFPAQSDSNNAIAQLRERSQMLVGQLKAKRSHTILPEVHAMSPQVSGTSSMPPRSARQQSEPMTRMYSKQPSDGQGSCTSDGAPTTPFNLEQRHHIQDDETFVKIVRELSESHGSVSHRIINTISDVQMETLQDFSDVKAALEALTQEVRSLTEDDRVCAGEFRGRLETLTQKIGALHSQDLPGALRALKESLDTTAKLDAVRAQEAFVSLHTLKDLLTAHASDLQSLKAQDFGEMADTFQKGLEEQVTDLQHIRERLVTRGQEEKSAADLVRRELEAHGREQSAFQAELAKDQAELEGEGAEMKALCGMLGDIQGVAAKCNSDVEVLRQQSVTQRDMLTRLREGMRSSNEKLKDLLSQSQALESTMTSQQQGLQDIHTAVALQAEHEAVKAEIEQCRWRQDQRQAMHDEFVKTLREDINRLRAESTRLKARQPQAVPGKQCPVPTSVLKALPFICALLGGAGLGCLRSPAVKRVLLRRDRGSAASTGGLAGSPLRARGSATRQPKAEPLKAVARWLSNLTSRSPLVRNRARSAMPSM